jgi:hypothetical protein
MTPESMSLADRNPAKAAEQQQQQDDAALKYS